MSRKKDANKYWIYGEDAALAAQFTAYLATVLKNRRLTYIRHLKKIQKVECSYEYAAETINPIFIGILFSGHIYLQNFEFH